VLVRKREAGIIINRTHENVLRFLPPYIVQKKHIDQLIKELDRALSGGIQSDNQVSKPKTRAKNNAVKPKAGLIGAPNEALAAARNPRADAQKEEEYAHA
jgi:hypothetical protein